MHPRNASAEGRGSKQDARGGRGEGFAYRAWMGWGRGGFLSKVGNYSAAYTLHVLGGNATNHVVLSNTRDEHVQHETKYLRVRHNAGAYRNFQQLADTGASADASAKSSRAAPPARVVPAAMPQKNHDEADPRRGYNRQQKSVRVW